MSVLENKKNQVSLSFYLKGLKKKEEQITTNADRRKKIIKVKGEINQTDKTETVSLGSQRPQSPEDNMCIVSELLG